MLQDVTIRFLYPPAVLIACVLWGWALDPRIGLTSIIDSLSSKGWGSLAGLATLALILGYLINILTTYALEFSLWLWSRKCLTWLPGTHRHYHYASDYPCEWEDTIDIALGWWNKRGTAALGNRCPITVEPKPHILRHCRIVQLDHGHIGNAYPGVLKWMSRRFDNYMVCMNMAVALVVGMGIEYWLRVAAPLVVEHFLKTHDGRPRLRAAAHMNYWLFYPPVLMLLGMFIAYGVTGRRRLNRFRLSLLSTEWKRAQVENAEGDRK